MQHSNTGLRTAIALLLFLSAGLHSYSVLAGNYRVIVKRITPDTTTGDVIVRVKPGKNENDFSGTAKVMLAGNDLGTDRAVAIMLTAVSLGAEVIIDVPNPPSSDNIQTINSVGLITP
jgi:hypothetical protein